MAGVRAGSALGHGGGALLVIAVIETGDPSLRPRRACTLPSAAPSSVHHFVSTPVSAKAVERQAPRDRQRLGGAG